MTSCPRLDAEIVETAQGPRLIAADGASFQLPDSDDQVLAALRRLRRGEFDDTLPLHQRCAAEPLLSWLRTNGLLSESASDPLSGWRVRLYGLTTVGVRLARGLLRLGVSELTIVRARTPRPGASDPLAMILGPRGGELGMRIRVDPYWTLSDPRIDLAVLAGPGIEPDRVVLSELGRAGIPSLVVSAHLGAARVGPLSAPGLRGCWRCRDLHICESDRDWPHIVAELSSREPEPRAGVAAWATSLALMQLTCYRRSGTCDIMGRCLCWEEANPGLRTITCLPHEACPCTA